MTEQPQESVRDLIREVKRLHAGLNDARLPDVARALGAPPLAPLSLRQQRVLRGHCAGVYAVVAAHRAPEVASVGMDNNLITWSAARGSKLSVVPLDSFYTLALAYSPSDAQLAFGGLDCAVYALALGRVAQLHTHDAHVADVAFLAEPLVLSGSADGTARVYDLGRNAVAESYAQHFQDVLAVDRASPDVFATGSADGFARVFDRRTQGQVQIFSLQHQACEAVRFHPSGCQLACAGGPGAQLFDLRSEHLLQSYAAEETPVRLCFSASGRLLFAACGHRVAAYDVFYGELIGEAGSHEARVTGVCLAQGGAALVSGGWDAVLRVWG